MSSQASFVILGVMVHWHVMAVIILAVAGCVEMVVWSCGDTSTRSDGVVRDHQPHPMGLETCCILSPKPFFTTSLQAATIVYYH